MTVIQRERWSLHLLYTLMVLACAGWAVVITAGAVVLVSQVDPMTLLTVTVFVIVFLLVLLAGLAWFGGNTDRKVARKN